jgi:hypothetical protein
MALTEQELTAVIGGNVTNTAGATSSAVSARFTPTTSPGQPTWVTVKTGLFGTSESFVPLALASVSGSDLAVNYDKDTIQNAPRVEADGHLTPEEEQQLHPLRL